MNGTTGQYVVKHVILAPELAPEQKLMLFTGDQNVLVTKMKTNHATQMNVQVCVNIQLAFIYGFFLINMI